MLAILGIGRTYFKQVFIKKKFEKIKKLKSQNLPTIPSSLEDELK